MSYTITLNADAINALNLESANSILTPLLADKKLDSDTIKIHFEIDYPRDPTDPRELSEIPEIRLWFIRLDAYYPWLPLFLDWEAGELGRYAAMLVPHQFS
nr:CRR6 family NdhI maturation factor [Leptolyngbyaceae cyanobacterium MO_188.B28]